MNGDISTRWDALYPTSTSVVSAAYASTYTFIAPLSVPTILVLVGASKVPSVVLGDTGCNGTVDG